MADVNLRSDNVDVEQIMRQIRMRIREKRGADYTEDEIRELASVKLERFAEPSKLRSGLLEQFWKARHAEPPENFEFGEDTIYASHRLPFLRTIRRWLNPFLKLFFNPNPMIRALHVQSQLNRSFIAREPLEYEVMSNLVLEVTRLGIEVRNLRMRLESLSTRLDFSEHRARSLEGVVQYKPGAVTPPAAEGEAEGTDEESGEGAARRRKRRRRGRRRPPGPGEPAGPGEPPAGTTDNDGPEDGVTRGDADRGPSRSAEAREETPRIDATGVPRGDEPGDQ